MAEKLCIKYGSSGGGMEKRNADAYNQFLNQSLFTVPAAQKCRFTFQNDVKKGFITFTGPINVVGRTPSVSLSTGTITSQQTQWTNGTGGLAIITAQIENVPKGENITADNIFCNTSQNKPFVGVSIQYDDQN